MPEVQGALRRIVPAVVGLGLATAVQMARPLLEACRREGRASLVLATALLGGSAVLFVLWRPPVLALLGLSGLAGASWGAWHLRADREERA